MNAITERGLAALAVKLMAFYVIISLIRQVPYIVSLGQNILGLSVSAVKTALVLGIAFIYPFVWAGIALLFIRYADGIASRLVGKDGELDGLQLKNITLAENTAFTCIGIIFVFDALPQLVELSFHLFETPSGLEYGSDVWSSYTVGSLASVIVQILLGSMLIIRAESVCRWIRNWQGRSEERISEKGDGK